MSMYVKYSIFYIHIHELFLHSASKIFPRRYPLMHLTEQRMPTSLCYIGVKEFYFIDFGT